MKLLTKSTGSDAVWSPEADGILYLLDGVPAKFDGNDKVESYSFQVAQTLSRSGWLRAGFDKAWLTMREVWYDDRFGNHNWDGVRRKYADVAKQMHDPRGLSEVVQLMLGELNGSHLGFTPDGGRDEPPVEGWQDETAHLGVRFDAKHQGPGLLVRYVILNGPADRTNSRLLPGDVILAIDGTAVDPAMDLTLLLNGRLDRDIDLLVRRQIEPQTEPATTSDPAATEQTALPAENKPANENEVEEAGDVVAEDGEQENREGVEGKVIELHVVIRPTSYSRIRSLLYDHWLENNRKLVDKLSGGKLGYLHIRAMDLSSFHEFERQLYNVGYGREGLVIDVRDNGGGSTTDLLLTSLTQPRHAITVPRGGKQGYPHDRLVFATWSKPIIVLCNQNSYSNAEIFSHAIKTLGRGKVVGVQTAGGVVSTGSARVNDVGTIRVPFRGWFLIGDGQDMEMNGCKPDVSLWPMPGELPKGEDRQLSKAVELLLIDVAAAASDPELIYASERK